MKATEAVKIGRFTGNFPYSRVELETAKRVLEDLLANIKLTLATAPSEMVRETNE